MNEIRSVMETPVLRRAAADQSSSTIAGYAAVFNSSADIGGMWIERIARGAFAESISSEDILALAAHDSGRILGRTSAGTLRLAEDDKGLAVEIDLPDTTDGRDVGELVRRRDIKGMSFGFIVTHDEWDETQEPPLRTIHQVRLLEVSAVGNPAYGDTSLAQRSREAARAQSTDAAAHNRAQAKARILTRKVEADLKFRGIKPQNSRD